MNVKALTFSSFLIIATVLHGAPAEPEWKIINTKYPTTDLVVAGFNVLDFGADPTGEKDCTQSFQNALNKMGQAGGGTVFVPEGKYAFHGSLMIPVSVTLRGEWSEPSREDPTVRGTLLMPTGGKDEPEGKPFITVDYCAGIKDLSIWYPQQSITRPKPYPWCLIQKGGDNATFENLTLVNPYQGIRIGPGGNELHLVRNVYGTPLKIGIQYDSTTDIGRLEKIRFSPHWWSKSGLAKAPTKVDWIKRYGTAIHMFRSDWEYVADVEIDGYETGYRISEGVRGAANAQFYELNITDCTTAMEVEKTNPFGMVFTKCRFEGQKYGVFVDEKFDSAILFSDCAFSGKEAVRSEGNGNILMDQCRIEYGRIALERGAHSFLGSDFINKATRIYAEEEIDGLILAGNQFANKLSSVKGGAPDELVQESDDEVPLKPIPVYPEQTARTTIPPRLTLEVVYPSGNDDAAAIQKAMDLQAEQGGGTVFLPGGDYLIKGRLNVPSGVELRGIHDVPHHTMGGGSVLHIYPSGDEPTVTLESKSGLRGLGFYYPEQKIDDVQEYPFLIQGKGNDIYIINVNSANPYRFIDLMTHRCDNHFIEYPSGAPLMVGVAIGGSSLNGVVQNMQFNPHYWARAPRKNPLYDNKPGGGVHSGTGKQLWEYQKENLDALVIGACENEFLYQNFVFGSLYGIHFTEQDGKGAINCISHGHGTDGSKVSAFFEHGHGTINMINNELVAMSSQNKTAIKMGSDFDSVATLINTMVWGKPDLLAEIDNGTLEIQNLHVTHHGKGMHLNQGKLRALNISFAMSGNHVTAAEGTDVQLDGIIVNGYFQSETTPRHLINRTSRKR